MTSNRSALWRRISAVGGIATFGALVVWGVLWFIGEDLDQSDKMASIVSMGVALISLPLTVLSLVLATRQGRASVKTTDTADRLDTLADALAVSVREQWESEEVVRRVHDPFPLPCRWSNADEELVDHWQNIHRSLDHRTPLVLDGHLDKIVDTFRRIPSGRLVVLGQAGSGKTILTSRFALTMLAERARGESLPVPVIFSMGSWDPTTTSLRNWLTDQLVTTYPILVEKDTDGSTLAARLLTTQRILPVLDGFDEITAGLRSAAIRAINSGLRRSDHFLMTSRPDEYAAAVATGDVLTAAAVVELAELTVEDLAEYLPLTTRKKGTSTKWQPVIDRLWDSPPHTPLADVLSTPLMVALARAVFSDTAADPADLLDHTSQEELETRLLAEFLPAVYANPPGPFKVGQAQRWLRFLARHIRALGTYDVAWWQLVYAIPRFAVGSIAAVVSGLTCTVSIGLGGRSGNWQGGQHLQSAWIAASVIIGPVTGIAAGIIVGPGRGVRPSPTRLRLSFLGSMGHVQRTLKTLSWRNLAYVAVWVLGGTCFGLVGWLAAGLAPGTMLIGPAAGLLMGVISWLVGVIIWELSSPADPAETVSPAELLRTDRNTSLRQGFLIGAEVSIVVWVLTWWVFEPGTGLPFSQVFGNGIWFLSALCTTLTGVLLWPLFVAVWGPWLIARFWLPLTGRLPWSVMRFLADAHRRGVLRQAGGVYQFRHARLRDHLAAQHENHTAPTRRDGSSHR